MNSPEIMSDRSSGWDVCVVGWGAGGAMAAFELCRRGAKVLLLESGRRFNPLEDFPLNQPDWEMTLSPLEGWWLPQNRNYTAAPGELLDPRYWHLRTHDFVNNTGFDMAQRGPFVYERGKGVGGSTLHYQGEAHRFDPDAFKLKTLCGAGEDWPIRYEDVAPYYGEVERFLGVAGRPDRRFGGSGFTLPDPPHPQSCASRFIAPAFAAAGLTLEPNALAILSRPRAGRPRCTYCGGCVKGCMIGAKSSMDVTAIAAAEETGRLTIMTDATALEVEATGEMASGVVFAGADGGLRRVRARAVVLAAGAIETPRLLLNSARRRYPRGLANSSGLVGCYLMETLYFSLTAIYDEPLRSYAGIPFDSRAWDWARPDPRRGFAGGVTLAPICLDGLGRGPQSFAVQFSNEWGAKHKDFMRRYFGSALTIVGLGEQLPVRYNRVELDGEARDRYGYPLARVVTRLRQNDLEMLDHLATACWSIVEGAKAARITHQHCAYSSPAASHVGGTCRMGKDARTSVVNPFGRSHDVRNLFVADASCLVTQGGGAAPSLTIQALALRTAGRVLEYLAGR